MHWSPLGHGFHISRLNGGRNLQWLANFTEYHRWPWLELETFYWTRIIDVADGWSFLQRHGQRLPRSFISPKRLRFIRCTRIDRPPILNLGLSLMICYPNSSSLSISLSLSSNSSRKGTKGLINLSSNIFGAKFEVVVNTAFVAWWSACSTPSKALTSSAVYPKFLGI